MILSEINQLNNPTATNGQIIIVKCDVCGKEWKSTLGNQTCGFKKYGNDLCRSCKVKDMYALGIRTNTWSLYNKKQTGKTFEERFGQEKGKKIRNQLIISRSGEGNSNFCGVWHGIHPSYYQKGKSFKEIYGEEKANNIKNKLSIAALGENNPMFGKPSPQGSGNGWSGWYKGWFFRSLKELSYMIYVIERFNLKWETGENAKYKIYYIDYKNNKRTYHPDFLINEKYLVEIKPKNLWNSNSVKRKKEAAETWCKEHNFIYKLTECVKQISFKEIEKLIKEENLIFTKRYQEKYKLWES